jgi:hypothetical protein
MASFFPEEFTFKVIFHSILTDPIYQSVMYCIKKCDIPANLGSLEIAVMDNRFWG